MTNNNQLENALIQAQDSFAEHKISDKIAGLGKTEERFSDFVETLLVLMGIFSVIFAIGGFVLGLVFLPVKNVFLHILFAILLALAGVGAAWGLFFLIHFTGTAAIISRGNKLFKTLISWANANSKYRFTVSKIRYSSSYGQWRRCEFTAEQEFFAAAKTAASKILNGTTDLVTDENFKAVVAGNIEEAKKRRDIDNCLIFGYLSQLDIEQLKKL